jgi:hypothetical protein
MSTPKFLLFPKRIYLQNNLISQKELTPDYSYFPKGLTLELVPSSQNKIYEHKRGFKSREREATHEKAPHWVEERKRLSKRVREREREKKEQIRSEDLKLAGVRWLH